LKSNTHLIRKIVLVITFLGMLIVNQITLASVSPDTVVKVEPYASTARIGETFTISITITAVQNLYGLEITLNWNASVLKIVEVNVRLGVESHSDGVLHEPIFIAKNETIQEQGKYALAASSTAPAASFDGSGNTVIITFSVTNRGKTRLGLETKLADKPQLGSVASPIVHTVIGGVFSPVHVFISPARVTLGENVNMSGFLAEAQADVNVAIQYRREGETDWHNLPIIKTKEKGDYLYTWQPTESGEYEIIAAASISGANETSYPAHLTVKALSQVPIWQYVILLIAVVVLGIVGTFIYDKSIKKQKKT